MLKARDTKECKRRDGDKTHTGGCIHGLQTTLQGLCISVEPSPILPEHKT